MTYTLTSDQYSDALGDLGIKDRNTPPIFTKAELDRLYARTEGDYDALIVYAIRQLLATASKFQLYTVGQIDEDQQRYRDNLKELLETWEGVAGLAKGQLKTGVISLGLDMTWTDVESISNS